jgi:methylated-DNA-[protein]-cysteine S-methyltransferase
VAGLVLDIVRGTPVGVVGAVWGPRGVCAVEIAFPDERRLIARVRARLAGVDVSIGENPAGRQLREYFARRRRSFDVKCDLDALSSFTRRVLEACARVPHGRVVTYGWLARALGSPRAARAVGQALERNPVPVIIPCHRVVAAASLGGFSAAAGLTAKIALLGFEGVSVEMLAVAGSLTVQ